MPSGQCDRFLLLLGSTEPQTWRFNTTHICFLSFGGSNSGVIIVAAGLCVLLSSNQNVWQISSGESTGKEGTFRSVRLLVERRSQLSIGRC